MFKSFDREFLQPVDLKEEDNSYLVSMDVPGVPNEDVNVEVNDDVLCISGERINEFEKDGYSEKSYGKFSRSFKLPRDANVSELEASCEHGVLHVVIPKASSSSSAHKVEVKEGKGSLLKRLFSED